MDVSDTPLFALADRRLAWVAARQSLLATNVANADTPKFHARDLKSFSSLLSGANVAMARTDRGHIGGARPGVGHPVTALQERSPDGNSVVLDKELVKIADTQSAHEVAMALTKKYLGMMRTAVGH